MTERSFVALLAGDIDCLRIAIALGSTSATRETPGEGIWRLSRAQFVTIAESLNLDSRFADQSLEQIAHSCDEVGIENRFFRLNAAVARWIDNNEPEQTIDFMIL
jgi:hypothetical protein